MINQILQGNCLERLKELEDNSVDSIVTDPPYELGFMGKSWDSTGIANNKEMWAECLRVLKPGGHLLAFSGTRTYHRMACAIEDAGFEVRDMIEWCYGSGFPKSRNITLDMDKMEGHGNRGHRIAVANRHHPDGTLEPNGEILPAYIPKSENAIKWNGWGTALKPAHEPICMTRKPLAEKTVAENCLKWGTGGINIDESRVGIDPIADASQLRTMNRSVKEEENGWGMNQNGGDKPQVVSPQGRFPANLIHDNSEEVRECFPETKSAKAGVHKGSNGGWSVGLKMDTEGQTMEYGDSGNASRFFKSIIYTPKASKAERNRGCEGLNKRYQDESRKVGSPGGTNPRNRGAEKPLNNFHPTVKPIALMEYLIKMVTPKGGIVLDPFAGSGSTLVAAKQNGFDYIGIELAEEYIPIIEARLEAANPQPTLI